MTTAHPPGRNHTPGQAQTPVQNRQLNPHYIKIGGAVVQWVEHWTCDQQVVGSNPTWGKAA